MTHPTTMTSTSRANRPRTDVPVSEQWNLTPLYSDLSQWEIDLAELQKQIPKLKAFAGTLANGAKQVREFLSAENQASRLLEKLYTFTSLRRDEDTTNSLFQGMIQRVTRLSSELGAAISFFRPEFIALPENTIRTYLTDPALTEYRFLLDDLARFKQHTLSDKEERLLAMGAEVFAAPERIFTQLENADFDFGSFTYNGETFPVSHATYNTYLKREDREMRRLGFEKYYQVFEQHKHSLTTTLVASIQNDIYQAKVRNYPSALAHALFSENIPASVYGNLIDTVEDNIGELSRYYDYRRTKLGVDSLRLYDTYVALVGVPEVRISYEQAISMIVEAVSPLGTEYQEVLHRGLTSDRWVDPYENKGKRSGAYSSGYHDSPPYILLNYDEKDIRNLFTLAHEAGHSMHSYYARRTQPYHYSNYSIFVAEVASTLNEQLLSAHLRKHYANDPAMLRYLVNQQLDDIKATLHRQAMFADFERWSHNELEEHRPLTVDSMRAYYHTLLEKYFGPSLTITPLDELEFLRIPHFYWAFYVYKYATGISASIALAEPILSGDKEACRRYLAFLSEGGSDYSLSMLTRAGVDLATPTPVKKAIELFGNLLAQLQQL